MSINMLSRLMAVEQTILQIMETLEFFYWIISFYHDIFRTRQMSSIYLGPIEEFQSSLS